MTITKAERRRVVEECVAVLRAVATLYGAYAKRAPAGSRPQKLMLDRQTTVLADIRLILAVLPEGRKL